MSENINSEIIQIDLSELDDESPLSQLTSMGPMAAPFPGVSAPVIPPWLANIGASAAGAAEFGATRAIPAAVGAASSSPLSLLAMLFDPFSVAASSQGYDPSALYQPWEYPDLSSFAKSSSVDDYLNPTVTTGPGVISEHPDVPTTKEWPKEGFVTKPEFGKTPEELAKDKVDPRLQDKYGTPPTPPKGPKDPKVPDWKDKIKEGIQKDDMEKVIDGYEDLTGERVSREKTSDRGVSRGNTEG